MIMIFVNAIKAFVYVYFVFSMFYCVFNVFVILLSLCLCFTTFQCSCVLVSRENIYFMSLGNILFVGVYKCRFLQHQLFDVITYVHVFVSVSVSWCCGVMCSSTAFLVSIFLMYLSPFSCIVSLFYLCCACIAQQASVQVSMCVFLGFCLYIF